MGDVNGPRNETTHPLLLGSPLRGGLCRRSSGLGHTARLGLGGNLGLLNNGRGLDEWTVSTDSLTTTRGCTTYHCRGLACLARVGLGLGSSLLSAGLLRGGRLGGSLLGCNLLGGGSSLRGSLLVGR